MSLGRLWSQQGKKKEARHALAAISRWFLGGRDTPALQAAGALLDEWA